MFGVDSEYNAIAKAHRKHIPVVLTLDNWWTGKLQTTPRGIHCPMVHPSTVQPSFSARRTKFPSLKTWFFRKKTRDGILLR